jgi:hypothetical protein
MRIGPSTRPHRARSSPLGPRKTSRTTSSGRSAPHTRTPLPGEPRPLAANPLPSRRTPCASKRPNEDVPSPLRHRRSFISFARGRFAEIQDPAPPRVQSPMVRWTHPSGVAAGRWHTIS